MRIFFFLLFCTHFFATETIPINEDRLQKKIEHPPCWMKEQIREDLSPFNETGITYEMLESTLENIYALPGNGGRARLAKVVIENNTRVLLKPHKGYGARNRHVGNKAFHVVVPRLPS